MIQRLVLGIHMLKKCFTTMFQNTKMILITSTCSRLKQRRIIILSFSIYPFCILHIRHWMKAILIFGQTQMPFRWLTLYECPCFKWNSIGIISKLKVMSLWIVKASQVGLVGILRSLKGTIMNSGQILQPETIHAMFHQIHNYLDMNPDVDLGTRFLKKFKTR